MSAFTNNLTSFCSDPDANGNTEAWGAGPHWLKGEMLHRTPWTYSGMAPLNGNGAPTAGYVPVAYSSNDVMWARAKWWGNIDPNIEDDLYVYFSAYLGGGDVVSTHVPLIRGDDGSWVMDDVSAKLLQTFAQICGQYAKYDPNLQLMWKLYVGVDGAPTARNAGTSYSCLYVTYGNSGSNPPAMPNPLYHSVVHIGCVAAQGQSTEQGVFNSVWAKFQSLSIHSVTIHNGAVIDNALLTYYGKEVEADTPTQKLIIEATIKLDDLGIPASMIPCDFPSMARQFAGKSPIDTSTTKGLLTKTDGICNAWTNFMVDVLGAQGISSNSVKISCNQEVTPRITAFKVKDMPGQGTNQPKESMFGSHRVVEYAGNIYDPSYGLGYGNKDLDALKNFMDQSLKSIGTPWPLDPHDPSNLGYGKAYIVLLSSWDSSDAYDYLKWG